MQLCSNWKGLLGIVGLCVCAGLLIELQDLPQHSFSPVFDWIDAKPKPVTNKQSLIEKPKEPEAMDSLPKKILDKVRKKYSGLIELNGK